MCTVMAITAATMGLTSAASRYQQHEAAGAQAEYQTEMYQRNKQNANAALAQQYNDIGLRQQQEQQASAQDKEALTRDARAKMATSRVAAGAAGISGISVEMGLRDISGAALRDKTNVDQNLDWTMGALQRQKTSARTGTTNQINSVQKGQKPSNIALGLDLANTAASSYAQYDSMKPKTTRG